MLELLSMIPILGKIVTGVSQSWFNAKVRLVQARTGADRDVAVKMVSATAIQAHENTSRLRIIASNKFLVVLLFAAALPIIGYEWKVIVWDKMLDWGSTDPITGQVADWANQIIWFLFGSPTVMALGKMWYGRNRSGE